MRAIMKLIAIGLWAAASSASAASPENGLIRPTLDCYFKDRDWDQREDLKCRVKVFLPVVTGLELERSPVVPIRRTLVVDCDRHEKLVTPDFTVGENNETWVSAKIHKTLVAMRVEGIGASPEVAPHPIKLDAELLLANRILRRLDGFCKYTPDVLPPAPPVE